MPRGEGPTRGAARAIAAVLACALALVRALTAGSTAALAYRHLPADHGTPRHVCNAPSAHKASCDAIVATEPNDETPLAAAAPYGYGPSDLQSAYGLTAMSAASGAGQTVAIVDAFDDPSAEADLGVFRSYYGLPACTTANGCFRKVNQTGGTSYPTSNASWGQEISLDLDMVSSICPNCHIILVEANSNNNANLYTGVNEAVKLGATQISNSYGGNEYAGETSDEVTYFDHPGIAITVSAGDAGYGVEFPAASQYVTAVGGTTLKQSSTPRGWTETAWNKTGSGCSSYEPKPAWQTDTGCSHRTVGDVSADADPNTPVSVYDSFAYQGASGWLGFGGTSVSSPIVAAYDALVGPAAATAQYHYAQASLYNDVTSGSNGSCAQSPAYFCNAVTGYDAPTGVGSIEGSPAPTVTTGAAGSITQTTASITGAVNPNGLATSYYFEYGTSASPYSQRSPATNLSAGSGTTSVPVATSLANLTAGTLYHYRLDAVSAAGVTLGQDQTFTTAQIPLVGGNWVGLVGSQGYSLADWTAGSDLTSLPSGVTVNLLQGSRYVWDAGPTDARALQSPDGSTREASTWYDPAQIQLKLSFANAYSGNLHLYAVDWQRLGRAEIVAVNGQTVANISNFGNGAWITAPVNVQAGGSVTITVTSTGGSGSNAVLSGIFLGDAGTPPAPPPPPPPPPSGVQGNWVGTYGAQGYSIADWSGGNDLTAMPSGVSVNLLQGGRYVWDNAPNDIRALESPDQSSRKAATWYDPAQIQLQLSFTNAYSGNLHLYAVDWERLGRAETIAVNAQTVADSSNFGSGTWVTAPISVQAGGSVTITVTSTGGVNAVLSGIFLGDAGSAPPPPPPPPPPPSGVQGNWVGTYGTQGYSLADWLGSGDLTSMQGATVSLVAGGRYVWDGAPSDIRALESPDQSTRKAASWYSSGQLELQVNFSAAYSGNLHLYAVDWDNLGRAETIAVNGQTVASISNFSAGTWITAPINVAAGGTVTITVNNLSAFNAVLSGIFLGDSGTPPAAPPPPPPPPAGVQGNWVGTYGAQGYDIADWSNGSDLTAIPGVTVNLQQGARYMWDPSPNDIRALQSPDKSFREATTWYDSAQIQLQLAFANAFSGNLHLYAVDWNSQGRAEAISVNGQTVASFTNFGAGTWVTAPVTVAAGGTVTIDVTNTGSTNAVLSGIFLN